MEKRNMAIDWNYEESRCWMGTKTKEEPSVIKPRADVIAAAKQKIEETANSAVETGLIAAYEGGIENGRQMASSELQERNDWQACQIALLTDTIIDDDKKICEFRRHVQSLEARNAEQAKTILDLMEQKRRLCKERNKPTPILSVSRNSRTYRQRLDIVRIIGTADGLHIEVV